MSTKEPKKMAANQAEAPTKEIVNAAAKTGKSAVINVWVDPNEYAPGTKNQTMYK